MEEEKATKSTSDISNQGLPGKKAHKYTPVDNYFYEAGVTTLGLETTVD